MMKSSLGKSKYGAKAVRGSVKALPIVPHGDGKEHSVRNVE